MQQLRYDEIGDLIFDRCAQEDDPLVQQPREDVELALAAGGALDDHRDQLHAGAPRRRHPIDPGGRARRPASTPASAYPALRCH